MESMVEGFKITLMEIWALGSTSPWQELSVHSSLGKMGTPSTPEPGHPSDPSHNCCYKTVLGSEQGLRPHWSSMCSTLPRGAEAWAPQQVAVGLLGPYLLATRTLKVTGGSTWDPSRVPPSRETQAVHSSWRAWKFVMSSF
jgi:hypothetical protein